MKRLDEIVAGMEDSQASLEAMIFSYEEGARLLSLCRQRLDAARMRVDLISGELEGGKAVLSSFDESPSICDEAAEQTGKPRSSARRRKATESEGGDIRLF